jgi:hypothetical protein
LEVQAMTLGYRFARHLMAPFIAHVWGSPEDNRSLGPYRRKAPAGVTFAPGTTVWLLPPAGVPLAANDGAAYEVTGVGMEGDLLVVNLA